MRPRRLKLTYAHVMSLALVVVVLLGLLSASAGGAAKPVVTAAPAPGAIDVSQAIFRTRGAGKGKPRLVLSGGAIPRDILAVGGVRKLRRGRYLASLAVIRGGDGSAAAYRVGATVRMPRGLRFAGVVRRVGASDVANKPAPKALCRSLPRNFSHAARRPLVGRLRPGYNASVTLRNAFWLGCRDWPGRGAFAGAVVAGGGSAGGDSGGQGDAGDAEGTSQECEDDPAACYQPPSSGGPAPPSTLTGSGSVTRDSADPNRYRYSIQFNEPVWGYRVQARDARIECPARNEDPDYPKCEALGDSQRASAGGAGDFSCFPGSYSYEFQCSLQQPSDPGSTATVPAGTTITGSFTIDGGSVGSGTVKVWGSSPSSGEASEPFVLSGPD